MVLKNFADLIDKLKNNLSKKRVAVVAASDEHTLEAVFKAANDGIVEPILIGDKEAIKEALQNIKIEFDEHKIITTQSDNESAEKAVELIHENNADFIMKGKLQTAELLKAVVNKEKGLRTGRIMSSVGIMEIPSYHKMICLTDAGMVMYPTLKEKKQLIENAVDVFLSFGYENPKVAVLAAVETVNPKMPETVEADALKQMYLAGEMQNCIVEGPISYDLTMNLESAKIKGFESPVSADADIILVPNITTGNILAKALIESAGAKSAGMILGAKVPIVVTSRATTAEEKYLSLVVAAGSTKKCSK